MCIISLANFLHSGNFVVMVCVKYLKDKVFHVFIHFRHMHVCVCDEHANRNIIS